MNAVCLSLLICEACFLPYGLGALWTCFSALIASCDRLIAASFAASVTFPSRV